MLKSYFKIAWRNLFKSKIYSSINIIGLATGMSVALLIGLWIWDETSFDHHFKNHSKLAQAIVLTTFQGQTYTGTTIAMPLGKALRRYGDDLKYVSLLSWTEPHILATGDKKISGSGNWAEGDFPLMLSLDMVKGNREALKDPSSMLIARSIATALFGNDDPVGKTVKVDNIIYQKVAGVYEDLPKNTSFSDIKILLPWENKQNWLNSKDPQTNWNNHCGHLFVQVNDQVDIGKASAKIRNVSTEHITEVKEETMLYPLDRMHLHYDDPSNDKAAGRIQFVWLFGIIGVFVLFLACINFMNLSTARSEKRAKEVGIRKTVGSLRRQLVFQFLSESVLMAGLSFLLALGLVFFALPSFNGLADKAISIPWGNPFFWLLLAGFAFFTGLIAGSYPAFYLSGFEPIKVLKGTFRVGRLASLPRKVLVIVQFTVSITLIIGTLIVYRQIQFAKDRPVGYDRSGLITLQKNTPELHQHYEAIRNELLQTGTIADMGETNSLPTEISSSNGGFYRRGQDPNTLQDFGTLFVSTDFGKTIGWKVVLGRDFSREFPSDSGGVILNEAAVKLMGLKNPVGEIIDYKGPIFANVPHTVVGVVKDMVMESPYEPAKPTLFFLGRDMYNIVIRMKPGIPVRNALAKIGAVFKKYNPESPFDFQFTDETYAKKFSDEQRIGDLATFFAILAVFISCLGLFGLASFVAEQRTKELGVRKVLGASVFNLWRMLSKDFVLLVLLSCAIAIPIARYYLGQWLQRYQYHIAISWWIFAFVALGALFITLLTVSYQAIKAALMNPVNSLRSE